MSEMVIAPAFTRFSFNVGATWSECIRVRIGVDGNLSLGMLACSDRYWGTYHGFLSKDDFRAFLMSLRNAHTLDVALDHVGYDASTAHGAEKYGRWSFPLDQIDPAGQRMANCLSAGRNRRLMLEEQTRLGREWFRSLTTQ